MTVVQAKGLVGDHCGAGGEQGLGQLSVGCQVKIGKQNDSRPDSFDFFRLGFFDLQDHVGLIVDGSRVREHFGPVL